MITTLIKLFKRHAALLKENSFVLPQKPKVYLKTPYPNENEFLSSSTISSTDDFDVHRKKKYIEKIQRKKYLTFFLRHILCNI